MTIDRSGVVPFGDDAAPATPPTPPRSRRKPPKRRRWLLVAGGLILLGLIALAVLAIPLIGVKSNAEAARADLTVAIRALHNDDLNTAEVRVASAREHVDAASGSADGFGGDVWSIVPVAGGAVKDMRHLVAALDDATSIAELGVDLYPAVLGTDATLIQDDTVNFDTLSKVEDAVRKVGTYLEDADASLAAVKGSAPVVGGAISRARDGAQEQITGIKSTYDRVVPIMAVLPTLLGTDGTTNYLIAVMNPAEMRYSGGATLTLAPMQFDDGHAVFADAGATTDFTDNNETIQWPPVENNPFHTGGDSRLVNATFSPYWPVSGEELLRAWQVTTGEECDAVVAIDLQAIAALFKITGPVDIPGYGKLTAANLVKTLAGSYDRFDSAEKRKAINSTIIPVFREKLLSGGKFAQKAQTLLAAADGRHFATYFRDPTVQNVFDGLALTGGLSDTTNDYIGVFTQNTNASKADYWQRRAIDSDVTLAADGTATVQLTVTLDNDSPPYARKDEDPKRGYFTRWSGQAIAVFLPEAASVTGVTIGGSAISPNVIPIADRSFFQVVTTIAPNESIVLEVTYTVPKAATVTTTGDLVYGLDVDPQAIVNPEAVSVTLHVPAGFVPGALPEEWTASGDELTYASEGLQTSPRWQIRLTKDRP